MHACTTLLSSKLWTDETIVKEKYIVCLRALVGALLALDDENNRWMTLRVPI